MYLISKCVCFFLLRAFSNSNDSDTHPPPVGGLRCNRKPQVCKITAKVFPKCNCSHNFRQTLLYIKIVQCFISVAVPGTYPSTLA